MSETPQGYSRDQLITALHLNPEYAQKLWNAFGFAHGAGDDGHRFTEADLVALATFTGDHQAMTMTSQLAAARAIGQATARLAQWEAEAINRLVDDPRVDATTDQLVEALSRVQNMVWRRHLAAGLTDAARATGHAEVVVGFADIVGYTSMSRRLGMTELEDLLETFESVAHSIITNRGGQVVKTIGDAVMFIAPDPVDGAEIAIALHRLTSDGELPELRIGMARGQVLMRMGDAFGEPVNIAARLAGAARAGTTLVDEELAQSLADNESTHVGPVLSLSVRGYRRLRAFRLVRDRNWRD